MTEVRCPVQLLKAPVIYWYYIPARRMEIPARCPARPSQPLQEQMAVRPHEIWMTSPSPSGPTLSTAGDDGCHAYQDAEMSMPSSRTNSPALEDMLNRMLSMTQLEVSTTPAILHQRHPLHVPRDARTTCRKSAASIWRPNCGKPTARRVTIWHADPRTAGRSPRASRSTALPDHWRR